MRARTGPVVLVILALAAGAGCSPTTAGRPAAPATRPPAADHVAHLTAAAAGKASPEQVRGQVEQLLGQHTLIAVRLMRSVVSGAPELRQATVASLQENTHALRALVGSAYGSQQGDRFGQLWENHVAELFAYANGVAHRDESAKRTARAALLGYCDDYGAWFAQASKGRVKAADAAAGVRMHVEELMRQIDVYAAHDYGQAYRIEREAYEHMFAAGAALAKASVTPEAAVAVDAPPQKLRSAFSMLLGEHMELVVDAQRATFAGSPEFQAAAAQIDANTAALSKAIAAITGSDKAAQFESAWADHVDGLMAYTAAVAGNDEAAKAAAKRKLDRFAATLARFLEGVVRKRLTAGPLTTAITMHDTHLTDQVDAYAARDYTRAQQLELDGYRQMLGVVDTLVDAIQRTLRPGLPVGGPKTGGGGTATWRR